MGKAIIYSNEAREKILEGVKILADTVSVTMGPKGRNVIIGPVSPSPGTPPIGAPVITKDGVTVARAISLSDPFQEMGAQLVKEVAGRTCDLAGDGTTTATVLAYEIFSQGIKLVNSGYSVLNLRDGLNLGLRLLLNEIDKLSKVVTTEEDLINVSTISANNDSELGRVIAKAYSLVERNGLVTAEAVPGAKNSARLIDGIELKSGYVHPGFLDEGESASSLERCYVLLTTDELSHIQDCEEMITEIAKKKASLLIIAKDLTKLGLSMLVHNHKNGILRSCGIKIPTFGSNQSEWIEDLSMLLGTTVFSSENGIPVSEATIDSLGYADLIEVGKYTTKITNPKRDEARISNKISQYNLDKNILIGETERFDIKKRKQFLTSKASVITIGYSTELELREKGDRVDDAMSAVMAAIEEGIVPGAGMTLFNAANNIDLSNVEDKYIFAVELLISACVRPAIQILSNAGENVEQIFQKISENQSNSYGYNVATLEFGDLFEMGVVDPRKVTRTALQNAVSIALLLLTTEAVIVDRPDDPSGWIPPAGFRLPSKTGLNHKY